MKLQVIKRCNINKLLVSDISVRICTINLETAVLLLGRRPGDVFSICHVA